MNKPDFTDAELNFISIVMQKADPLGVIDQAQSTLSKLKEYGKELAASQADDVARKAVGEE